MGRVLGGSFGKISGSGDRCESPRELRLGHQSRHEALVLRYAFDFDGDRVHRLFDPIETFIANADAIGRTATRFAEPASFGAANGRGHSDQHRSPAYRAPPQEHFPPPPT